MHIYIFISYASSRQSQELLYLLSFESEPKKPETEPNRTGTLSVPTRQGLNPAKPEPEPNRTDPFRGVIAHSYEIFIWGFLSYQSDEIFYMKIFQLSIRWDFYMRILQLSILLTHMRFLYENLSIINQMKILYENLLAINIIDEHQTQWAFNHRWASNRWAFNHRWASNRWHQKTNHSSSLYNIYDRVWMSFSHASVDVDQKISSIWQILKTIIWVLEWWTWWKIRLEKIVNLMKIKRRWIKRIENLMKINHTIIIWMSISQASVDMQEKFSSVWQISKTIIWKSESWTWSRWWIEESWTWWKSNDLNQIIEKASTVKNFERKDYTYTS
jgi:hypothetical protein